MKNKVEQAMCFNCSFAYSPEGEDLFPWDLYCPIRKIYVKNNTAACVYYQYKGTENGN